MNDEDVAKRKILYELEDEIWALLKRKAWIAVFVVGIVGIGGIWATVHYTVQQVADGPLRDLQKQLVHAEIQADAAKRANATASNAAEQVRSNLDALQGSLRSLGEQAKGVEVKFTLVSQQIDASSKNAALRSQRDFNAVQERIAALEVLVKKIGEESAVSRQAAADYAKQVAALENKIDKEQKRFAENSSYSISILVTVEKRALAVDVQRKLASAGFRAALLDFPLKGDKNILSYNEKSEGKAKEVLALLSPPLRDIELRKLEQTKYLADFKRGMADLLVGGWVVDPNSFTLTLGGT